MIPTDIIRDPARSGKLFKHQVFEPIGQFYGWAEYRLTTDGKVAELEYPSELPANKKMCHGAMRLAFSKDGAIQVKWRAERSRRYELSTAVAVLRIELAALCAAAVLDRSAPALRPAARPSE